MKEYYATSVAELAEVATAVVNLAEKIKDKAVVLALHGDLGAGKTTFMQTLAMKLGVEEMVTSPTFVVMKKYKLPTGAFEQLVHIDAYRIEDVDEMRPLRFHEELEQKGSIIGIEWAEKIESLLPTDTIHIDFATEGDRRVINVHGNKN